MKNRETDYWKKFPVFRISFLVLLSYFSQPVLASDSDGDGYTDVTEIQYDWNSTMVDIRRKGGISRSKSAILAVNLGGGAVVKISSDPVGLFSSTSEALPTGDTLTTPTIQTVTNNKRFLHWERNGVVVRGPGGTPKPAVVEGSPGIGVKLVAKYIDLVQDSDTDGILDWFEIRSSGLDLSEQSDEDGDGFSLAEEQNYGFTPHFKDSRMRGGISRNRSSAIGVSLGGGGVLNIASNPRGVVDEISQPVASNDSFDTVILNPTDGNKRFVYWERMGIPVRLTGGTPTPRVTESEIGSGINMVAKYENENRDSDNDHLADWFELRAGGMNLLPSSDTDSDGFTLAQEHRYGFSPFLRDLRPLGGISRRRSQSITLIPKEDVPAPAGFADLDGDGITDLLDFDTDGDGSTDSEEFINGTNQQDANSTSFLQTLALHNTLKIDFGQGSSNPLQNNWKSFASSANNADLVEHNYTTTLATSSTLKIGVEGQSHWRDYRAISSGPHKSLSNLLSDEVLCNNGGTIVISLSGLQVGTYQMTTYHHASEGHGSTTYNLKKSDASGEDQLVFSGIKSSGGTSPGSITTRTFNLQVDDVNVTTRIMLGPRQGNSGHMVLNGFELSLLQGTPPDELSISKTGLSENSEIGTVLANLQGVDHENNSSFSYSLVEGIGDFHNSFFSLSNTGDLLVNSEIDYEKNSHLFIRAVVLDEFNNTLEKIFTLSVEDVFEDLDGDGIEDHLDHDLDGDGFINSKEISYGSNPLDPNSVANAPPFDINGSAPYFTLFENQPIGTIIGDFNASDPDPWAILTYSLHGSSAPWFSIDSNGTLSSGKTFNFEEDPRIFSLVVRVSDEHNYSDSITHEVHLLDRNEPPYDLLVDTLSFHENLPHGSKIAQFNASDPDANTTLSWSLTDENGSVDNKLFELTQDGMLTTAVSFDYENDRNHYTVLLKVIDEHNFSKAGNFTLTLLDANDPPTDLNVTAPLRVLENQPAGTLVGQFTAYDPDIPSTLSYRIDNAYVDKYSLRLDANGTLWTKAPLDFEANATLTIRVKVEDQHGAWIKKFFTIEVLNEVEDFDGDEIEDAYDPDDDNDGYSDTAEIAYGSDPRDANSTADTLPTDMILSSLKIMENQPIGTIVGQFTVIDPDPKDTHVVRFKDTGASVNHLFTIDANNTLRTAAVFDFENNASSLILRVQAIQRQKRVFLKSFTLSLINDPSDDAAPPLDQNTTQPPVLDGNDTHDHNVTLPPIVDGNDTLVDHNDTVVEPPIIEPVTPKYVPIVRTQEVVINDRGAYVFRGRILTDGGADILEAGIEISQSLGFRKSRRLIAELDGNNFQVKLNELEAGARYYYRAFANNEVGESPGARKRLKIPALPQPTAWWAKMRDAGNGWTESAWFGAFQKFEETEWIYHTQLGWIYAPAESKDGIWLWMDREGWLWTNRQAWPYLWKHDSGSWLYFQGNYQNGRPIFFDYASDHWR